MNTDSISVPRPARARLIAIAIATGAFLLTSACSPPPPRSFDFFLADGISRDGTLARCDREPAAAQSDIECANARRAALAIQLREEQARREALERESAAKIEALRRQFEAQRRAERAAAAAQAVEAERRLLGGVPPTASRSPDDTAVPTAATPAVAR